MSTFISAFRALDDGRHRAEFYRMWRAGQSAGLTLPHTFETMGPREAPHAEAARRWLLEGTTKGRGITDLVRTGGARFEQFERSLLTLGEESGSLDGALRLLADFYTKKHKLMLWVKKQMAYPFFTALFAAVIWPLQILLFGDPRVYALLAGGSVAAILLAGGSIVGATARYFGNKPRLARARFARSLATAIEAGLPLARSLRLAADASSNDAIRAYVGKFSERQLMERPVSETMARCPHMMPDLLAVIETAERTGDYTVLARFADLYEDGFK